ncbi:MAG: Sua5/YciO/YrdC/YwlC family protein [Holophagales bacterium]|nr:Sua5/YciO/YrdC/YwlC family protein [Holophagales bacterium]
MTELEDRGRGGVERRYVWGNPVGPVRRHLAAGGVVGIPSESSYGVAADPRSVRGVEAIYSIKERERGKPLPVVAADVAQLAVLGIDPEWPPLRAVAHLWPSPLTVVVPTERPLPASAGVATLAVRVPAHTLLRRWLSDVGFPVTATSANRAGEPPILDTRNLRDLLGRRDAWIVDDGVLPGGPPSTLVAFGDGAWRVLRPGALDARDLPLPERRHESDRGTRSPLAGGETDSSKEPDT